VILGAVYASIFAQLNLGLLHGHFDHGDDKVALAGNQGAILKSFIVKFNREAVVVEGFVHALNRREVIRPLTMIFVVVEEDVFHEVEFNDALLVPLAHDEDQEGEKIAVFELGHHRVVLAGE